MKIKILCGAAVVALLSCVPASAQRSDWQAGSSWNHDSFWQGAGDSPLQRVSFVQQRINRGIADRTLDRREAQRVQYQLNSIRRDASRGRMTPQRRDMLNQRLDDLSRQIRWARNSDGRPGYNGRPGYEGTVAGRDDDRRFETTYDARRYYCKRNVGTTGLVIGAIGGGVVGNVIDGGHNRVAGTLIGGVLGALAGKAIDQGNSDVRCR